MALTPSTTLVHLPLGEREDYGSPYPAGLAVGHIDQIGDASGGAITASFLALDQFLYRLELMNVTKDDEGANDVDVITVHEWATAASGFGDFAFSLNWNLTQTSRGGFSVYQLRPEDLSQIRRFPIGSVTPEAGQFVAVIRSEDNTLADVWDYDVVFSYWPKTALFLPGFLSSFFEAPEVAPAR